MIMGLIRSSAPSGFYHATNSGDTSWYGFARAIFDVAGIAADVSPIPSSGFPQRATRPRYSVLDCSRTSAVTGAPPHWRDALADAIPDMA